MGLWGYEQEPHSLKKVYPKALSLEWVNQSVSCWHWRDSSRCFNWRIRVLGSPNIVEFQYLIFSRKAIRLDRTINIRDPENYCRHASETIEAHWSWSHHRLSNWKSSWTRLAVWAVFQIRGQWSDPGSWKTCAWGNRRRHSAVASARSSRMRTFASPGLTLHHVKGVPLKPRSRKQQSFRNCLKLLVWERVTALRPSF